MSIFVIFPLINHDIWKFLSQGSQAVSEVTRVAFKFKNISNIILLLYIW